MTRGYWSNVESVDEVRYRVPGCGYSILENVCAERVSNLLFPLTPSFAKPSS